MAHYSNLSVFQDVHGSYVITAALFIAHLCVLTSSPLGFFWEPFDLLQTNLVSLVFNATILAFHLDVFFFF